MGATPLGRRLGKNLDRAGPARPLLESQIAGSDVSMEPVFAAGVALLERTEEPSFVYTERGSIDVSGPDRSVRFGIISGVAHRDSQVAGVQFDVLVAIDARELQIA